MPRLGLASAAPGGDNEGIVDPPCAHLPMLNPADRDQALRSARLRRLAAGASLVLASTLALAKLSAALASNSVAVLASLVDSLADILAAGITVFSVRVSQLPPDTGHRFGHGKAEALTALAQSVLVGASALFVVIDALSRLGAPAPIEHVGWVVTILGTAIAATLGLLLFQAHVVKVTGSQAIAADSLHYRGDLATNLTVIASVLVAEHLGWPWFDPLMAAVIALYLACLAWGIGRRAINTLMDHELPRTERQRVEDIVLAHDEVLGMHDLRTREAGGTAFIELHIEIDAAMTVAAAHVVTDTLEAELATAFPDAAVIIHQEPAGVDDLRLDHVIAGKAAGPVA